MSSHSNTNAAALPLFESKGPVGKVAEHLAFWANKQEAAVSKQAKASKGDAL